jgi:hypothetical protein
MDRLTDKRVQVNSRFSKFCEFVCYGTESTEIGINFESQVQKISLKLLLHLNGNSAMRGSDYLGKPDIIY